MGQSESIVSMKVLCLVLLVAVAAQAENCQVYRSGLEAIFSKVPNPESLLTPDGVCEDGEGWGCIAEIAKSRFDKNCLLKNTWPFLVVESERRGATVMDCIAQIGMDPAGVQKCVEEAIGTASDCYDCVCWVMESVGLGCPSA